MCDDEVAALVVDNGSGNNLSFQIVRSLSLHCLLPLHSSIANLIPFESVANINLLALDNNYNVPRLFDGINTNFRFLLGMCKAGFAGDDAPRAVFPSIVGRPRHQVKI